MKKRLLIVAVLVLSSLSLWAGIDTILSVKTYFDPNNIPPAGFNYDGSEKYGSIIKFVGFRVSDILPSAFIHYL